jgi:hypothetical protein
MTFNSDGLLNSSKTGNRTSVLHEIRHYQDYNSAVGERHSKSRHVEIYREGFVYYHDKIKSDNSWNKNGLNDTPGQFDEVFGFDDYIQAIEMRGGFDGDTNP